MTYTQYKDITINDKFYSLKLSMVIDGSYGADADGNRSIAKTFIDDIEILDVYDLNTGENEKKIVDGLNDTEYFDLIDYIREYVELEGV